MIRAEILGVPAVTARLKQIPPDAQRNLSQSVGRLCLQLERTVKESKLTGQVLHVRTGRLRRSIHSEVHGDLQGTEITGTVGTNVEYAAAHEYGFNGTETVRSHIRNLTKTRTLSLRGKLLKHPKKEVVGSTMVRAFTRHANIPEKSFLRSALGEMAPEIQQQLQQAVNKALRGAT